MPRITAYMICILKRMVWSASIRAIPLLERVTSWG
jgi:hypothetical protein